jgi:hypothetical protein
MHPDSLMEFEQRKQRLLARTARQRVTVAAEVRALDMPLAVVDRGLAVVRFCKSHPLFFVAGAVGVLVVGRRNLATWAGRGWVAWRAWRSLSSWVEDAGREP